MKNFPSASIKDGVCVQRFSPSHAQHPEEEENCEEEEERVLPVVAVVGVSVAVVIGCIVRICADVKTRSLESLKQQQITITFELCNRINIFNKTHFKPKK